MTYTSTTTGIAPELLDAIRGRFAHLDTCPFEGDAYFSKTLAEL